MKCSKCIENGSEKYILKGDKCEKYIDNPSTTNINTENPHTNNIENSQSINTEETTNDSIDRL